MNDMCLLFKQFLNGSPSSIDQFICLKDIESNFVYFSSDFSYSKVLFFNCVDG